MTAVPSPTAVTIPFLSTVATELLLDVYVISSIIVSGCLVALIADVSPTFKSKVLLSTVTLALSKLTFIMIVLFSAAAYLSSPAKETVIIA